MGTLRDGGNTQILPAVIYKIIELFALTGGRDAKPSRSTPLHRLTPLISTCVLSHLMKLSLTFFLKVGFHLSDKYEMEYYFATNFMLFIVTGKNTEGNIYAQPSKKLTPSPRTYDNARPSSSHDRGRRNRVSKFKPQLPSSFR